MSRSGTPRTIFLDEGALDGKARFPSACAVVVEDEKAVETAINVAMGRLLVRPDFSLEPRYNSFRNTGFHYVEDNFLARQTFISLIATLDVEWWCVSNLHPFEDPYETLPQQFEWIIEGIFKRFKTSRLHFVFENNSRLDSAMAEIVESTARSARGSPEHVTFSVGTKSTRALALADYCLGVSSHALLAWIKACCATEDLNDAYEYRQFTTIEPSCSVLYSWDALKVLSSRPSRLADKTYFDVTGSHSPSCSREASDRVTS